jgi:hypothetical protein
MMVFSWHISISTYHDRAKHSSNPVRTGVHTVSMTAACTGHVRTVEVTIASVYFCYPLAVHCTVSSGKNDSLLHYSTLGAGCQPSSALAMAVEQGAAIPASLNSPAP